jgi:hypothetical protein
VGANQHLDAVRRVSCGVPRTERACAGVTGARARSVLFTCRVADRGVSVSQRIRNLRASIGRAFRRTRRNRKLERSLGSMKPESTEIRRSTKISRARCSRDAAAHSGASGKENGCYAALSTRHTRRA